MKEILERGAIGLVAVVLVLTVGVAAAQGLWYKEVEKDGRTVNGVSAPSYNEFLLAAQAAF